MDYKSGRWRRLRAQALARDRWQCRECRRYGVAREAAVVHHVRPVDDCPERQWDLANLVSLCAACHNAMHVRGGHELSQRGLDLARRAPPPDAPRAKSGGTGEGRKFSDAAANA